MPSLTEHILGRSPQWQPSQRASKVIFLKGRIMPLQGKNTNYSVHCVSQSPGPKRKTVSHPKMTFLAVTKISQQLVRAAKLPVLIFKVILNLKLKEKCFEFKMFCTYLIVTRSYFSPLQTFKLQMAREAPRVHNSKDDLCTIARLTNKCTLRLQFEGGQLHKTCKSHGFAESAWKNPGS